MVRTLHSAQHCIAYLHCGEEGRLTYPPRPPPAPGRTRVGTSHLYLITLSVSPSTCARIRIVARTCGNFHGTRTRARRHLPGRGACRLASAWLSLRWAVAPSTARSAVLASCSSSSAQSAARWWHRAPRRPLSPRARQARHTGPQEGWSHARTTCERRRSICASLRMMEALAKRICTPFSLIISSTFSSSALRPTSAEVVVASSSESSPVRRWRSARQLSSSLPIDSRSSCTYSRQRPSGLDDWQRVWMDARSALTSPLEGILLPAPVALPFLPRMIPLLLSA